MGQTWSGVDPSSRGGARLEAAHSPGCGWCARGLSVLAVVGALACTSEVEPAPEARGASNEASAVSSEPQRMVQHLAPASNAAASASDAPSAASAGAARRGRAITPKHLEAELDRLEAELAK